MTRGEIWKDFFKRTVLPAVIALFLFFMFKNVFTEDGQTNYFYVWLCCGIPFGIRRMFVWLVPHGYDIAGTVGIIALNFILGGIIGGVILIWRLVVAAWYIPLTIYRLLTTDKGATLKSTWKNSKGKTGTQTVSKDYPRPGFSYGCSSEMLRSRTPFLREKV